ncbi:hypothetical protein RDI58_029245 [Solanum bulbocastanum]|uniref:Uncharacterized protein n=1 Tax=Solanum bulbocastanum TaxID=147425 RepID=A0AAN8SXN5_SOLBU
MGMEKWKSILLLAIHGKLYTRDILH